MKLTRYFSGSLAVVALLFCGCVETPRLEQPANIWVTPELPPDPVWRENPLPSEVELQEIRDTAERLVKGLTGEAHERQRLDNEHGTRRSDYLWKRVIASRDKILLDRATEQQAKMIYLLKEDSWVQVGELPDAVWDAQAIAHGSRVFIFPTSKDAHFSGIVYDFTAGTLDSFVIPADQYEYRVAKCGGLIYLFGGVDLLGEISNQMWSFSPVSMRWSQEDPVPDAHLRRGSGIGATKESVFLFGGVNSKGEALDTISQFSVGTGWGNVDANIQVPRWDIQVAEKDGKLYLFGGSDNSKLGDESDIVEMFDPEIATITPKQPLPYQMRGFGVTATQEGSFLIVGGIDPQNQPVGGWLHYPQGNTGELPNLADKPYVATTTYGTLLFRCAARSG